MRERCHACETGEQHASYGLYGRRKGRRFAVYVPDDLAEQVRQMLDNGRALQALLYEAGQRHTRALKHARTGKR